MADFNKYVILLLIMSFNTTRPINPNITETTLLPGVIRSYVGRTVLIQDYVSVTLNHTHTLEIPTDLKLMLGVINQIHMDLMNLSNIKSNQDRKMIEEIIYTNTLCKTEIKEALQWFPSVQNETRKRRGLQYSGYRPKAFVWGISSRFGCFR